ncbi:MAG: SufE family protein [Candidatus Sericytochromatia bacterium]
MKSIEAIQTEIVSEFQDFDDWQDKYEYMIELGYDLPPLDEAYKDEAHRIVGCQSNVWLQSEYDAAQGVMRYAADSEALIVKGLVSLLIQVLNGQPPEAVVTAQLHFLNQIGLDRHLSTTRSNGLAAMIQEMKRQATLHLGAATSAG